MSAVNYRITEQRADNGGAGMRPCFGVALYIGDECVRVIGDISPDREAVQKLIGLFNDEELDPVHLDQAVEDFLYDNTI